MGRTWDTSLGLLGTLGYEGLVAVPSVVRSESHCLCIIPKTKRSKPKPIEDFLASEDDSLFSPCPIDWAIPPDDLMVGRIQKLLLPESKVPDFLSSVLSL
jgi:hypothetical protein